MLALSSQGWSTFASLATALGTLVLALATFAAVRSANRASQAAERSLLAGLQPILVPSRPEDPPERIRFNDDHWVMVSGGRGTAEAIDSVVYLTLALRNMGQGLAVLDRWHIVPGQAQAEEHVDHAPVERFRRLTRDIYVPAGFVGFWQGALRGGDPEDELLTAAARAAVLERRPITIELLYADLEGGQRTVSRFILTATAEDEWTPSVSRHWTLDRDDPR